MPIPSSTPLIAEAERLRAVFQAAAERELAAMALSARAVIRAWAEAELAIEAARRSQEPGGAELPSAETFRVRPHRPRELVSSERITRWADGHNTPLSDEDDAQVVYKNTGMGGGAWMLTYPNGKPRVILRGRCEYERRTYLESQARIDLPALAASLAVPAVMAGGNVGWEPMPYLCPASALAQLDKLEAGYLPHPAERARTVEHVEIHRVGPPPREPGAGAEAS